MAQINYANVDIAGNLTVSSSVQVQGIRLDSNGISKNGTGHDISLTNSQVSFSFSGSDWRGNWENSSVQISQSQLNFYSTSNINFSSQDNLNIYGNNNINITGNDGGITITKDNYYRLWANKDNLQIVTTGWSGKRSNLSTSTLTENRRHELPNEDGTLATKEWVLAQLAELLNQ